MRRGGCVIVSRVVYCCYWIYQPYPLDSDSFVEHKIHVKKKEAFDFVLANTRNVQRFEVWRLKYDVWSMTYDVIWRMTSEVWRLRYDFWIITSEIWRLKYDVWRNIISEVWRLRYDVWGMTSEIWRLKYDVWSMMWEVWSLKIYRV